MGQQLQLRLQSYLTETPIPTSQNPLIPILQSHLTIRIHPFTNEPLSISAVAPMDVDGDGNNNAFLDCILDRFFLNNCGPHPTFKLQSMELLNYQIDLMLSKIDHNDRE
jgi:hypothetical protein